MAAASGALAQNALAGALAQVERAVDDELDRLNHLQCEDLESIRRRRLAELKRDAERKRRWESLGHGRLHSIDERQFFADAKQSERVVVCFSRRGNSVYGDELLEHLARIAQSHVEARFVALDAERSPFLTNKLHIWCLPSITLVRDGRTDHTFHGLSELSAGGAKGGLRTEHLEQVLFDHKMLTSTVLSDHGRAQRGATNGDSDDDDADR